MLQRPQTLLFLGAAILAFLAAFAPIASYSPDLSKELPRSEELNLRVTISPSNMSLDADYMQEIHQSKKKFEEGRLKANEGLNRGIEESGYGIIFTIGMFGCFFLGIVALILVFLFNNRKIQIRLGIALFIISLITTGVIFLASQYAVDIVAQLDAAPAGATNVDWSISYGYGIVLFPAIAILLLVGVLLVRKDDNLVKSLDRLR